MVTSASKEIAEELRQQWKKLWRERFDDKVRAEGVAEKDYSGLFVEKGTVIFATRDFKPLNFREILEQYRFSDGGRLIPPDPSAGGWGKFIKKTITSQRPPKRRRRLCANAGYEKDRQQLRKGGRGWLHK